MACILFLNKLITETERRANQAGSIERTFGMRGRPLENWKRTSEKDAMEVNKTWGEQKALARDRDE